MRSTVASKVGRPGQPWRGPWGGSMPRRRFGRSDPRAPGSRDRAQATKCSSGARGAAREWVQSDRTTSGRRSPCGLVLHDLPSRFSTPILGARRAHASAASAPLTTERISRPGLPRLGDDRPAPAQSVRAKPNSRPEARVVSPSRSPRGASCRRLSVGGLKVPSYLHLPTRGTTPLDGPVRLDASPFLCETPPATRDEPFPTSFPPGALSPRPSVPHSWRSKALAHGARVSGPSGEPIPALPIRNRAVLGSAP